MFYRYKNYDKDKETYKSGVYVVNRGRAFVLFHSKETYDGFITRNGKRGLMANIFYVNTNVTIESLAVKIHVKNITFIICLSLRYVIY